MLLLNERFESCPVCSAVQKYSDELKVDTPPVVGVIVDNLYRQARQGHEVTYVENIDK